LDLLIIMKNVHIITPVKDSWDTTRQTIEAIALSETTANFVYTVYNDFSTNENRVHLEQITQQYDFELLNLEDITSHPSPNYLLILQMAQQRALAEQAHLIVVESDVVVRKQTIQDLINAANADNKIGMVASVTVDEKEQVNFPYLYARKFSKIAIDTKKRFSFCCTLLSYNFLQAYDFKKLNPKKSWYDVFISHQSVELGFKNRLLMNSPVLHQPHSSRPWKQLKYTNPLKYYWVKYTKGFDKI